MYDLSLFCAPKRASADQSELMGSHPGWIPALRRTVKRRCANVRDTRNVRSPPSGDLPVGQRLG